MLQIVKAEDLKTLSDLYFFIAILASLKSNMVQGNCSLHRYNLGLNVL